jgi:Spy/CpxP family protein refolding chaperone
MTKKVCACMFGALLALMLVPAVAASAENKDAEFTSYLESDGIHLGTASETANMGRAMCQDLDAGYTQSDEVNQLTQRLSQDQAKLFVLAATAEYCPSKHPAKPGS